MPSALTQGRLGHELDVDQVEQRLRTVLVDHPFFWTSALSRLSKRRDEAVIKRLGAAKHGPAAHAIWP
jgi:hypothetical protein